MQKRDPRVPLAKELQIAARRRKVAEMMPQGITRKEMIKRLGISGTTLDRDIAYVRDEANRRRLGEAIARHGEEVLDLVPITSEDYKATIEAAVIELVTSKKTYREIVALTGLPLGTISKAVNAYLRNVGDFAGRTADEWRTQQLILIDEQRSKLIHDSYQQAVPHYDVVGQQDGWEISPSRAAQIRGQASKILIELMYREAKLLGLDQQVQEVKITREIVHEWAGVDDSKWPKMEVVDGEWDAVG
jgi:uncharacterized protein YerC